MDTTNSEAVMHEYNMLEREAIVMEATTSFLGEVHFYPDVDPRAKWVLP